MGVFKRGDVWWIDYRLHGRRYRESANTKVKAEARELLKARLQETREVLLAQRPPPEKCMTISQLRDMWLNHAFQKKSIDDDRSRFEVLIKFFGPAKPIDQIDPGELETFKRVMLERRTRRAKPYSPATINRQLTVLRSALNLAIKRDLIAKSPFRSVAMLKENNVRERVCSKAEYELLINNAKSELRLAIIIGYWTAMRLGEIANLTWDNVNLQDRVISLQAGTTKNGDARQIPIADPVHEALVAWKQSCPGPKLFRARMETLSRNFGYLTQRLKIRGLVFHTLRHTALSNLRRAGADLHTLKAIGGHRTLTMLQRYIKVEYDDVKLVFDRLAR